MISEFETTGNVKLIYWKNMSSLATENVIVFLGGLTDGLLSTPYLKKFAEISIVRKCSFFQPLLRSSYSAYGYHSLNDDAEDLKHFLNELKQKLQTTNIEKIHGKFSLYLVGHSTGCQDIIHFLTVNKKFMEICGFRLRGIVLQGPVSDREAMDSLCHKNEELKFLRKKMVGMARGLESTDLLPIEASKLIRYGDPLNCGRFLSFSEKGGLDDMFSSDLTTEELKEKFCNVNVPVLLVQSSKDEYLPEWIDAGLLAKKLSSSFPISEYLVIEGADHGITKEEHQEQFIEKFFSFISCKNI